MATRVTWAELREFLNGKIQDDEPIDSVDLQRPVALDEIEVETGDFGVMVYDV